MFALACTLASLAAAGHAQQHAWYAFNGNQPLTGNAVRANVYFTLTGGADNNLATGADNILTADYANVVNPFSRNRSDLLNVLLFNLSSSVTISTANGVSDVTTSLWSGSTIVNSANVTVPSQTVNGSWVFGAQTDPDNRFRYGLSAAGFSNPGGAGAETYSFSGFTTGNGGDNYSLIPGDATRDSGNLYVNGANLALTRGRIRLRVADTNLTALSQITGVGFGYQSGAGATGYAIVNAGKVTIPEPASGALALVGLLLLRRRRA